MAEGGVEGRRRGTRERVVKSYRPQDEYAFLDEGESGDESDAQKRKRRDASNADEDEDEDVDADMLEEEEDEEEFAEDIEEEDEEEDDDEEEQNSADEARSVESTPMTPVRGNLREYSIAGFSELQSPFTPMSGISYLKKKKGTGTPSTAEKLRLRGMKTWSNGRGGGKEVRLKDLFGPNPEDLLPVLQTRDRWAEQRVLPRRDGGLRRSYFAKDEYFVEEKKRMRDWYSSVGAERFSRGQRSKVLSREDGEVYTENSGPQSTGVLMGPSTDPELYTLKKGACLSTAKPFEDDQDRKGWVINLGSRVQTTAWAINEEGSTQYLAVAVQQTPAEVLHEPMRIPQAPAFMATPGFPSSIQIWSFAATEIGEIDTDVDPSLEVVVCTDWGMPKCMQWCPVARADSLEPYQDHSIVDLGLLAGIWSDGKLRILDISYEKPKMSAEPQYIHYANAAFEVQLPDTIPTCLHWLSGTSLAVGTAAGSLAIWTLHHPGAFLGDESRPGRKYSPPPWFYRPVSNTNILSVTSGAPSRPTYVSVSSGDGLSTLIDLRSPIIDTCTTSRGRLFFNTQVWHDHTQSFLMPDESFLMRHCSVRRYYTNVYSMRVEHPITCIAASPVHPGILIGSADGSVAAGNPIGRIINAKEIPVRQIWFAHEWRQPVDSASRNTRAYEESMEVEQTKTTSNEDNNTSDVHSQPLVRITEGFGSENVILQYSGTQYAGAANVINPLTIHEEKTSVTSLAWNPNLKFGTWACAGMGSGILRVEDLAV